MKAAINARPPPPHSVVARCTVAVLVAMAATAERPREVQFVTSKDFKKCVSFRRRETVRSVTLAKIGECLAHVSQRD